MTHPPFGPRHAAHPTGSRPAAILTLKIDGQDVGARSGDTILTVARENDIHIPTLCHLEGLSTLGSFLGSKGTALCIQDPYSVDEIIDFRPESEELPLVGEDLGRQPPDPGFDDEKPHQNHDDLKLQVQGDGRNQDR